MLGKDKKGISGKESYVSSPGAVTVVWAIDPGVHGRHLPPLVSTQPPWKSAAALLKTGWLLPGKWSPGFCLAVTGMDLTSHSASCLH